jgi:hypothetical protein
MGLTAFTGCYATHHSRTVGNGLFTVKGTLLSSETLTDDFGIFVD